MGGLTLDRQMLGKPKEKYWISYIRSRIKKNKNFLGFISGQTGSGKSWSSLSIAHDLDPDFSIDRVVFSGLELMELINSGNLKRGSVIVFEEVGVEMSNRNWASVTNKMLNYLIQTFRHRGFILIMNSPYSDFIDSATRKLFHAELQTQGIDFNTSECRLKPQLIQYNARIQKFYYKRLKVIRPEGVIPVSFWKVSKPPEELIQAYEKKKRSYTDSLNKRILSELQEQHEKQSKKKALTDIQQDTLDMLKKGLTMDQIAVQRGRAKPVIWHTINLIKKKGFKIIPKYQGKVIVSYEVIEPGK